MKTDNKLVNAKVVYKEVKNNRTISSKGISGQVGNPVHLDSYKQYIPKNYQFEGYGYFNRYLKNGDTDVIYVSKKDQEGTITVDYINSDNQLIHHQSFTNQVGSRFNVNQCKKSIPKNYQFSKILTGKNINKFKTISQIMLVQVNKIKKVAVTIKYVNNNNLVGKIKTEKPVGSTFDINRYVKTVPEGYAFSKIDGKVPNNFEKSQNIKIEVTKKHHHPTKLNADNKSKSKLMSQSYENNDPKAIGDILMKLASSLHDLGMSISKSKKL